MQEPPNVHAQTIVVVDDDIRIRDLLRRTLVRQGFSVVLAHDAASLQRALQSAPVDLVLLDVRLPGDDGYTICQRLRAQGNPVPLILMTAFGDTPALVAGLNMGADDYLDKPFDIDVLVARVRAVLRRRQVAPSGAQTHSVSSAVVEFAGLRFDMAARRLTRHGEALHLTHADFAVLRVLVLNAGRELSREQLLTLSRGRAGVSLGRAIDMRVSRLRRLIEDNPAEPRFIRTVWNHGYVFVPDGDGTANRASEGGASSDAQPQPRGG